MVAGIFHPVGEVTPTGPKFPDVTELAGKLRRGASGRIAGQSRVAYQTVVSPYFLGLLRALDAVGPGGFGAAGGALDDEEATGGEPSGPQAVEHGGQGRLVDVVGRVDEHEVGARAGGRVGREVRGHGAAHDPDAGQAQRRARWRR